MSIMSQRTNFISTFILLLAIAAACSLKSVSELRDSYCEKGLDKYEEYCSEDASMSEALRKAFDKYCDRYKGLCESSEEQSESEQSTEEKSESESESESPESEEEEPESEESESESETKESESESEETEEVSESSEESESESSEESETEEEDKSELSVAERCKAAERNYKFYCKRLFGRPGRVRKGFEEFCEEYAYLCGLSSKKPKKSKSKSKSKESKPKRKKSKSKSKKSKSSAAASYEAPKDPNQEFRKCCRQNKEIAQSCKYLCSFDKIDKATMIDAFFRGVCPGRSGLHVINCASWGEDHRACCSRNGLRSFHNGLCLPFCYPSGSRLDISARSAPCLDIFTRIVQCFERGMPKD